MSRPGKGIDRFKNIIMKLSILQQDLFPALSAVSRSAGVRSQLPVLGNILLQTDQGRLKMAATNLEIGVLKSVNAEVYEEGEITVPAKTLVDIISNLGGEKIELSAQADQLKILTSNFSSVVNGIPATEFPTIPLSGENVVLISPDIFLKSLPQIMFASAVEDGRPVLTGILMEINDKKLRLVATDGYRLAYKVIPLEGEEKFKSLVPRRTFEELVRLVSEEDVDKIAISTSDDQNQIIFRFGNTELSSRLIEGQFPAWEKIIPGSYQARVILERAELLKAVKLASVFAKSEANIVKLQNQALGKLIITAEAKELGSQRKEIDVQTSGEELQIAFNGRFLQDALSAFNGSQMILEFSGALSAAVLKPIGEDGLEYIIMPVNLS